jgi:predicted KAP-like P-loop ATPase
MWSDRETEHDCLGFSSYVATLAEVCLEKNLAPLTLGIFGSWGSGKTSLMHMLKKHVEAQTDRRVLTLWFNAWRYEGREEAQSALIHAILQKVEENKTFTEDVKATLAKLKKSASVLKLAKFVAKTAVTLTAGAPAPPDFGGFLDCFSDESAKLAQTMESFERDFETLIQHVNLERVLVFIDDLDRCTSEKVLETFETIKLFLNIPECTFVIGADSTKIEQAVAASFNVDSKPAEFARDYLEKIVQIPFRIPEQGMDDIACYIGMLLLGLHLTDEGRSQLVRDRAELLPSAAEEDDPFTRWTLKHKDAFRDDTSAEALKGVAGVIPHVQILARSLRGNPRQIKRFMNILGLRTRLAASTHQKVGREMLIKLLALEYAWPDFFAQLSDTVDLQTGKSLLLAELFDDSAGEETEDDSKLVSEAKETTGLVEFLTAEPKLTKDTDLRPYLFLAQTALSREGGSQLAPLDETARRLASQMRSTDRVRAKVAAQNAANQEPVVVATIVRLQLTDLATAKDDNERGRILASLEPTCRKHPAHLAAIVKSIDGLTPSKHDFLALSVSTILSLAEKAGVGVSDDLKGRFKSKISEALGKAIPRGAATKKR